MSDLVFVLVTVGFFALAAAYIRACARIVGGDHLAAGSEGEDGTPR